MGEEGWSPERKGLIQSDGCLETGKSSLSIVQFGLDPGPWVCSISLSLSCFKGHYWDNWQHLNEVCRLDDSIVSVLISWTK